MKYYKILAILVFSSVILFYSCDDNPNAKIREIPATSEDLNSANPTDATTTDAATAEPTQNASGVYHYTCSNGCSGGAGSAVNCSNCGQLLVHNTAYHGNTNSTSSQAPFASNPTTTAGKNAAGVWHYTCPSGCAGGSGSAGTCSNCGNTLAHNQAYH